VRSQITPVGQTEQQRFQSALKLSECRGCVTERLGSEFQLGPDTAKLHGP